MYDALLQALNQKGISINDIREAYMVIARVTGDDVIINAISDLIRILMEGCL